MKIAISCLVAFMFCLTLLLALGAQTPVPPSPISNGSFIDASSTYVGLSAQWKYVTVVGNGTQYYIIGNN